MTKLSVQELIDIGVIRSGHFPLSCGRHSDAFVECSRLFSDPELLRAIVSNLAQSIIDSNTLFDIVISPAIGGMAVGYELARQLSLPFIYTEKQNNSHYLPDFFDIRNKRILLVDDVITSGRTIEELCSLVSANGGMPSGISCIVNKESICLKYPMYSYLSLSLRSYDASNCPLCKPTSQ